MKQPFAAHNMKEINSISISIYDIVRYLSKRWIFYIAGALLGALIAFGISRSNAIYMATAVLNVHRGFETIPNAMDPLSREDVPFDLIAWIETQRNLADFMREVVADKDPANAEMRGVAASMASSWWFAHHITPAKFLPAHEAKELLAINSMIVGTGKPSEEKQELKFLARAISETARISQLHVRAWGKTPQEAIARADVTADATLNALAMLRYRALIDSISQHVLNTEVKLASEREALKLKLSVLEARQKKLLRLQQDFPVQPTQSVAITDAALIKYLPISSQLVANSIDIDDMTEQLATLAVKQQQNALMKTFVDEAQQILRHQFVARQAIEQLLKIEATMRERLSTNDPARLIPLDTLRAQLLANKAINNSLIKETPAHISQAPNPRKDAEKGAWMGLALALLLSLLISIFMQARAAARLGRD
ncbi:hypothetical protein [Zwartia vadi]|uniref:hypothetical protein n=1 Tax=Zwartia vadi TaxID=3058168 RepID=UPI0025B40D8E|nr:hypothetical protein [Zwartia vadi]MDN3988229.1 hypothetical protein [Zwartia vadi]